MNNTFKLTIGLLGIGIVVLNLLYIFNKDSVSIYYTSFMGDNPQNSTKNVTVNLEKWMVFATNNNPNYAFITPLTAKIISKTLGYKSLIFLVGNSTTWETERKQRIVRNALEEAGARIVYIECPPSYTVAVSQIVRIFAAYLPVMTLGS